MTLNRTPKLILPKFQRQAQAKAGQAKASLKFCFLATLNLFLSLSRRKLSDEDHRLRIWNFKSFAAAYIAARQHIVNAHHVIARLGETRAVLFIGMARRCAFFRASQPAHIILGTLAAERTRERHAFSFRLLVKKVSFVHTFLQTRSTLKVIMRVASHLNYRQHRPLPFHLQHLGFRHVLPRGGV